MAISLSELATLVAGTLHGNPDTPIDGAAPLDAARSGEITLIDHARKIDQCGDMAASAVVIPQGSQPSPGLPAIEVEDVHSAFSQIVMHFRPPRATRRMGISPQATVDASAHLDDDVDLFPGVTVGADVEIGSGATLRENVCIMPGCRIGRDTTIMPGAVLYEDTVVGSRCLIHANAVLGGYGFGYQTVEGRHKRCAQLGNVMVEDDVEIGASTTVDRGVYGATRIGEGTKIDNLVQIAHNCRLGKHNMICSQVGIAGSTTTGDYVVMAGQVGVRDHVHIGNQSVLGAKAGVVNHVADKTVMIGIPATLERDQKLKQAALAKLPEMRRQFKALQREMKQIQARLDEDQDSSAAA